MLRMTHVSLIAEDAGATPRPVAPDPQVIARLLLSTPEVVPLPGGTRYVFTLAEADLTALRAGEGSEPALLDKLAALQALEAEMTLLAAHGPARLLRAAAQALLAEALARRIAGG